VTRSGSREAQAPRAADEPSSNPHPRLRERPSPDREDGGAGDHRRTDGRGRGRRLLAPLERARVHLFGLAQPEPAGSTAVPAWLLFGASVAFYPAYQLLTHGRTLLSSMWAEMGTNYYPAATSDSLATALFATDVGYIPFPQRLIGLLGHAVGISPAAFPYYFTASALLLSALLIGSVCLPAFRPVIASDGLRFLLAIALMLLPDFETRSFINFTYFGIVVAGFVTALALVSRDRPVPAWSWLIPLLMVSKPQLLTVLPAMIVVGILSRGRFRRIVLASVAAATVQAVRLALSANSGGTPLQHSDETAVTKLYAGVKYALGVIGRMLLGPAQNAGSWTWMVLGLVVVMSVAVAMVLLRSRPFGLVVVGLLLVFFSMLVNAFTFSALFTRLDMTVLSVSVLGRHFIVAIVGMLFVVTGVLAGILESPRVRGAVRLPRVPWAATRGLATVGIAAFVVWVVATDWLAYAVRINQPLGLPVAHVSQWTQRASELSAGEPIVCIPLDPFGWEYGRNCEVLVNQNVVPYQFGWATPTDVVDGNTALTLAAPAEAGS
jgi:hypothetical protein